MATVITTIADPVTLGGTIIQASTLSLPAGEYERVDWATMHNRIDKFGRSYFAKFPKRSDAPANWEFYSRRDVSGLNAQMRTIVAIETAEFNGTRIVRDLSTMRPEGLKVTRRLVVAYTYHWVGVALTAPNMGYTEVVANISGVMLLLDPETANSWVPVTNGTRLKQEADAFVMKAVAASVPSFEPAYLAASGSNPNV